MAGEGLNLRMWLATGICTVWALRLSIHIWARHRGEDYRYKNWREEWEEKGNCYYLFKAFWFVYLMQGFFSIINASSLYFINLWSLKNDNELFWTDYVGAVIWLMGFIIEWVSDQ